METMTFTPNYDALKQSSHRIYKLNGKEHSFISNINLILELIIKNTLKFNKLTSSDEIYDSLMSLTNNDNSDLNKNYEMEVNWIESICDILCANNGILIKLQKKDECFYKLNNLLNL